MTTEGLIERLRQPDLWVAVRDGSSETIDGAPVEAANEIERLSALQQPDERDAEIARLREALQECRLQLEYLDGRLPTGTTPAILARTALQGDGR